MINRADQVEALTSQSVRDTFRNMLSIELTAGPPEPFPENTTGQIIGSVGYIGPATAVTHIHTGLDFARTITAQMLGIAENEVDSDEMVNDAIGELSNIVVGFVKSRLCDSGAPCTLTIPSVVRGRQLSVVGLPLFERRVTGFRNGVYSLTVEILVKKPQGEKK